MRAMKDSGVEWVDEIPQDWNISRIKSEFDNLDHKRKPVSSEARGDETRSYNYYGASGVIDKISGYIFDETLILIGEDGANLLLRNLPLVYIADGKYWVNNHAHVLRAKNSNNLKYMAQQLEIIDYYKYITGSTQPKLTQNNLANIQILVPPTIEQEAIANYLDKKCGQIESFIEKQQTVIEKLKAYKQSVIAEAVTKGLDPSVPMKDSGTEWIGKIPQEWEIKRLKYCFCLQTRKANSQNNPVALENIESWSGRYIATESVFDGEGVAFEKGDILFGKLRPYLAKVYLAEFPGTGIGDFLILRPQQQMHGSYSAYLLRTHMYINVIDGSTYGAKMPRASWEFMGNLSCIVPPIEEQKRIAEFVNSKCAEIDNAIEQKQKLIDRLNDYKKFLIFEAVTGKIEV